MGGLEDEVDLFKVAVETDPWSARSIEIVHSGHSPPFGLNEREVYDNDAQCVERCVKQVETRLCLRRRLRICPRLTHRQPTLPIATGGRYVLNRPQALTNRFMTAKPFALYSGRRRE